MVRLFDILVSLSILIVTLPFLLLFMFLIYRQDGNSPFYIAPRMGKGEKVFSMVKLRSMVKGADKSGVDSTSANDMRITPVGQFIRSYKIDELPQMWNVLTGKMSLVGPRPNVQRDTDLYTEVEKGLLSVRPGITDFSSIVFSDEGEILADKEDPDISYNQLIRPWKSRMGLVYVKHQSVLLNIELVFLTALSILNREAALKGVASRLDKLGAGDQLVRVALRIDSLEPFPPPGANEIVTSRET